MKDCWSTPFEPDRRRFLCAALSGGCAFAASCGSAFAQDRDVIRPTIGVSGREALYYERLEGKKVVCRLCPKECQVADRERGYCGVRENQEGVYKTLVYGRPCSVNPGDPVEKKPLFHYLPGTKTFSIATAGCNVECTFCQNWNISQFRPEQIPSYDLPPLSTVRLAKASAAPTIAYTYTEPVIFYEYMLDTAIEARKLGVGSVMISNGYIQEKPLRQLAPNLTGVKIDFKGFSEEFYEEYCHGEMKPVLEAMELVHRLGLWLELVVLIIPTLNDGEQMIHDMCAWVYEKLGPDVPMHFTRFHPTYKMTTLPSTPVSTLEKCRKIAMEEKIRFAYAGNVPGHPGENTCCPECGAVLIQRVGFHSHIRNLSGSACQNCKNPIPGVWSDPLAADTGIGAPR